LESPTGPFRFLRRKRRTTNNKGGKKREMRGDAVKRKTNVKKTNNPVKKKRGKNGRIGPKPATKGGGRASKIGPPPAPGPAPPKLTVLTRETGEVKSKIPEGRERKRTKPKGGKGSKKTRN